MHFGYEITHKNRNINMLRLNGKGVENKDIKFILLKSQGGQIM